MSSGRCKTKWYRLNIYFLHVSIIFRLTNSIIQNIDPFWGKGGGLSNEFKMTQCSLRVFNLQLSDGNVTAGYLLISPFKGKLHSFVCLNSCAETSTYMKNKGNKEAIFKSHFRTQTFFSHSRYFLKLCYILANNFRHY